MDGLRTAVVPLHPGVVEASVLAALLVVQALAFCMQASTEYCDTATSRSATPSSLPCCFRACGTEGRKQVSLAAPRSLPGRVGRRTCEWLAG